MLVNRYRILNEQQNYVIKTQNSPSSNYLILQKRYFQKLTIAIITNLSYILVQRVTSTNKLHCFSFTAKNFNCKNNSQWICTYKNKIMSYLFKFEYTFETISKQRHYTTTFTNYKICEKIYPFIFDAISLLQSKTHYIHGNILLKLMGVMVHKYHHSYLYWHFQL